MKKVVLFILIAVQISLAQISNYDFILEGQRSGGRFGCSISSAGDVNNDGFEDLLVAEQHNDDGIGKAYIYLGGSEFNDIPDITFEGREATRFGRSVSSAGDLNNDGYSDIIVGVTYHESNDGAAYVYFGGETMDNEVDIIIKGDGSSDYLGPKVCGGYDINNDGFDDLIISSSQDVQIFYGSENFDSVPDVKLREYVAGLNLEYLNISIVGDVNNDGYQDILIGYTAQYNEKDRSGMSLLYFGGSEFDDEYDVKFTDLELNNTYGKYSGALGDINNDGIDDFAIHGKRGEDYIVNIIYGASNLTNKVDYTITLPSSEENFGLAMTGTQDINADGFNDFLVGGSDNWGANINDLVYLYTGSSSGQHEIIEIFESADKDELFGNNMIADTDLDGNGVKDFAIGAEYSSGSGFLFSGRTYIILNNSVPTILSNKHVEILEDEESTKTIQFSDGDTNDSHTVKLESDNDNIFFQNVYIDGRDIKFTIIPTKDYFGQSKIKVTLNDNSGKENNESVTELDLTVLPVNDFPIISKSEISVNEGEKVSISNINLEFSDVDSETDSIWFMIESLPVNGILQKAADTLAIGDTLINSNLVSGVFSYLHNGSETVKDEFLIKLSDSKDTTEALPLELTIIPVNDKPIITEVSDISIFEDASYVWQKSNLYQFIEDAETADSLLTFSIVSDNFTLTNDSTSISFIPNANWNGIDNLTFVVSDGDASDSTTIKFIVNPVNDLPELTVNNLTVEEGEELKLISDIFNISDVDTNLDSLFVIINNLPLYGQFLLSEETIQTGDNISVTEFNEGLVKYLHDGSENTLDSILIKITDSIDTTSVIKVIIKISSINDAPVISAIPAIESPEDVKYVWQKSELYSYINDADSPTSSFTFEVISEVFEYEEKSEELWLTPKSNWFGNENITLIVSDGLAKDTAKVNFVITSVNDVPTLTGFPESIEIENNVEHSIKVWEYCEDIETADSLLLVNTKSLKDSLTASMDYKTGLLKIKAKSGFIGEDKLTVEIVDQDSGSVTIEVSVLVKTATGILDGFNGIPKVFALSQNYPNPFNPTTRIMYSVPKSSNVKIYLYDQIGRKVKNLVDGEKAAGNYEFELNASELSSGVYFYIMQAGDFKESKKLILLK